MNRLKKYFEVKPYEVLIYRIWALLIAFFVPVYGLFLLKCTPDPVDYMTHRWSMSAIWILFFLGSFTPRGLWKYIPLYTFIYNIFTLFWIFWVVSENNFSFEYSIGLMTSTICIGAFLRDKYELTVYLAIVCALCLILLYQDSAIINTPIYGLSMLICFIVLGVVMLRRQFIYNNMVRLNDELIQKNQELEQFVYVASHDLKTPLRTIGSFASLLKRRINKDHQDKDFIEYTDFIVNGVNRMNNTINDLLNYSQYTHGELETEEIDLHNLLEIVWSSINQSYPNSVVRIHVEDEVPEKLKANPTQIQQLFQNLIDNGIKYNRSEEKQIAIEYQHSPKYHIFNVRDNGIGILPKYKHKIFKLFQRLHKKDEFQGTGVGLAICKRIVENHKGTIKMLPTETSGTIIQFSILRKL